jgi:hypothetical protein
MTEQQSSGGSFPSSSPDNSRPLRLGAYVLLADPAYLEESIRSYYGIVQRAAIVYDESGLSWTGKPLPLERLLSTVRSLDPEGKFTYHPGNFHDPALAPLEADTHERNAGMAALGDEVDWVLQIDTDEVLGNPARFLQSIERAEAAGLTALDYPARWIYGHVNDRMFLERCRRNWGISAGYPGPVAVRSGTKLTLARQCDQPSWRVDFRPHNTDPAHPRDARIDEQVRPEDGIWHFSWVRSEAEMRLKSTTSGHVNDFDWTKEIDRWSSRCRHPYLTTLFTPVRRHPATVGGPTWLRTVKVPADLVAGAG